MLVHLCLLEHGGEKSWAKLFAGMGKIFFRNGQNFFPSWARFFPDLGKIFSPCTYKLTATLMQVYPHTLFQHLVAGGGG